MEPAEGGFSPERVQEIHDSLPVLLLIGVASASLIWLLYRSRKSPLAPATQEPREPPLWGAAEILIVFGTWFFVPLFVAIATSGLRSRWGEDRHLTLMYVDLDPRAEHPHSLHASFRQRCGPPRSGAQHDQREA